MEGVIKYSDFNDWSYVDGLRLLPKKRGTKKKIKYVNAVSAFDIECTNDDRHKMAFIYTWQWSIDGVMNIYGRTWAEFRQFINDLADHLPDDQVMVCYVHNLSYEFQFIKTVIDLSDVFAMDVRSVLKCNYRNIEFRCSYLHSNMSLDKYLKRMNVANKKVADYDYSLQRYPWTGLSEHEINYIMNDVIGLTQAVREEMKRDNDDLYTIPLTSTGYERREAKHTIEHMRPIISHWLPDADIMALLRKAFRGGNTHANRYNAGLIIPDCYGFDISSSYIAEMCQQKYPKTFYKRQPNRFHQALRKGRAILADVELFDVRLKRESFGCPYLPRAKCDTIAGGEYDNGRVLRADYVRTVINEIDYTILTSEYDFTFAVITLYTAVKQMLPVRFREMLLQQYADKTALKGIDPYLYQKQKAKLNSSYGMMVQNPIKPECVYKDGMIEIDESVTVEELIEKYQRHGWLPYQWGVWVTAYARLRLERGIQCIPDDAFIYADTDSVKFSGDYLQCFEELNKDLIREELSAPDPDGIMHYLGIFEYEGRMKQFKTYGAKKYAYTDRLYNLHITVAGVSKRRGALELGSIHNFNEGFIFTDAGGTESVYNDKKPDDLVIDGHRMECSSNVYIHDSTYTLMLTMEYRELISYLKTTDIRYDLHYER